MTLPWREPAQCPSLLSPALPRGARPAGRFYPSLLIAFFFILSCPGLRRRRRGGGRLSRRTSSAPKPQADLLAVPVSFQNQFCWPPLLPASQPCLKLSDGAGRGAGRVVGGGPQVYCRWQLTPPLLSSTPCYLSPRWGGRGEGVARGELLAAAGPPPIPSTPCYLSQRWRGRGEGVARGELVAGPH